LLTHPTLDQMHQLGLAGMARAFAERQANPQSADLSHAEWLGLLLDREATERYQKRLRARLRYARRRHQAAVEDVDYRAARGLDRSLFQSMIAGHWIDQAQNLIIEGPAGVGKSWLACSTRSEGLPRQSFGALSAHPPHVRRSGIGTRRWPLSAPDACTGRGQATDPR